MDEMQNAGADVVGADSGANSLSEDKIDTLMGGTEGNRERAMQAPPKQVDPNSQEYTLKISGKDVKAPIDKILQWAQMGYNYPQKAAELNKQQTEWQQKLSEYESKYGDIEKQYAPYRQIDEYAAKNPDWWEHVQSQWEQRAQMAGEQAQQSGMNPELAALKEELNQLKAFREELVNEKKSKMIEQEDRQLAEEVNSIRKQFSNIDFDTPDENGLNLEMKVLQHAESLGIDGSKPGAFRIAFRDFYHDHLINKAQEQAKENLQRDIQKRTKLGIVGSSDQPTKGLKVAEGVRHKSYDDLLQEALSEINGG